MEPQKPSEVPLSAHSLYSPSSAHRWIACPGSMAFPENQAQDGSSSIYADDGTASHYWAGLCLENGKDALFYLGVCIEVNAHVFTMDEYRAEFVQTYLDDVRRRAIGGKLFVEYKIDLSDLLGEGQGGTMDAGIILGDRLIGEDLKYGTGEKVDAAVGGKINPQLGLYLLGLLRDAQLLGHEIKTVTGVICQPRLGHIDEHTISVAELEEFGRIAAASIGRTELTPGEKQCRWCRAKAVCPALAAVVMGETRLDFDDETGVASVTNPPAAGVDLAKKYQVVPLVKQWCDAIETEMAKRVAEGQQIIGPDGKFYKFVEGREGHRSWDKSQLKQIEEALVGQLGPKAYAPQAILTAPAAAKLLDKAKTAATWEVFKGYITRGTGKPMLVIGSDPRPGVTAALASDFEEQE
jgi:Protein of unknown function (DUF2800)